MKKLALYLLPLVVIFVFSVYIKNHKKNDGISPTIANNNDSNYLKKNSPESETTSIKSEVQNNKQSDSHTTTTIIRGQSSSGEISRNISNLKSHLKLRTTLFKKPSPNELETISILSDQNLKIWKNTSCVQKNNYDKELGEKLAEVSNLVIYQTGEPSTVQNFQKDKPIVLWNSRLKAAQVLTGTIKIESKIIDNYTDYFISHGLNIAEQYPEIGVYFIVSTQNQFDLEKTYQELKSVDTGSNVMLEILQRTYEKK